uniref:Uncharacterized protein n=1 Tax=Anguilla anguilla TaxID=7936 RepID=A0A0E9QRM0_ANGAN
MRKESCLVIIRNYSQVGDSHKDTPASYIAPVFNWGKEEGRGEDWR